MKRTRSVSVKEYQGLMDRLHALGWVSNGWHPVSGAWRFVELPSRQVRLVKASSEVEALHEVVAQLEGGQDGRPAATPSTDGA